VGVPSYLSITRAREEESKATRAALAARVEHVREHRQRLNVTEP
jgi:hypothetical protein